MEFVTNFIMASLATLAFAVLFSAPLSELVICGLNGGFSWIIYYYMTQAGYHKVLATLVAAFVLAVVTRLLAAIRKKPVTVYLLPGIFPLVPGAGIYYTAYYLFVNDKIMGYYKGMETFQVAGVIVIGIIMGAMIPQRFFNMIGGVKTSGKMGQRGL